jgi:hypothetical protein
LSFAKTGISEVEQVLFYSIPGSIFVLFLGFFVALHNPSMITVGLVAGGIASTIPIGFLLFQAYTANALWIYGLCLQRRKQKCLVPIQKKLKERWNGGSEEIYQLSKRVLSQLTNDDEKHGSYIWRLVAIINARGVRLFASVMGFTAPLLYFLIPQLFSICWPLKLIFYYAVLSLVSITLYIGIPKVRRQLDTFQELLVADRDKDVDRLIKQFVKGRSVK